MIARRIQLPSPEEVKAQLPLSKELEDRMAAQEELVKGVLSGQTQKLLVVVGPCSAHDEAAILRYAERLGKIAEKVKEQLVLVLRVYTTKPRTRGVGYKGMVFCPDYFEGERAQTAREGLYFARRLHLRAIEASGLLTADEMLCPENLPYFEDVVGYHAVGARSSEDEMHRAAASGLNVPVGIKNPMSGSLPALVSSVYAAQQPQAYFCGGEEIFTDGNPFAHAVLRGYVDPDGRDKPNFGFNMLLKTLERIEECGEIKNPAVLIDTNHSNTGKQWMRQKDVAEDVLLSRKSSSALKKLVKGFMIESFLEEGNQAENQQFGRSVTDPCLSWEDTERLLYEISERG